jgi:hypothetical protein
MCRDFQLSSGRIQVCPDEAIDNCNIGLEDKVPSPSSPRGSAALSKAGYRGVVHYAARVAGLFQSDSFGPCACSAPPFLRPERPGPWASLSDTAAAAIAAAAGCSDEGPRCFMPFAASTRSSNASRNQKQNLIKFREPKTGVGRVRGAEEEEKKKKKGGPCVRLFTLDIFDRVLSRLSRIGPLWLDVERVDLEQRLE